MLNFRPRGLEEFRIYLHNLTRRLRGKAVEWISDWLIGDSSHGFKHYVPYRQVTRQAAYGRTFESDKQRRYVMARIAEGTIDPGFPHRTGRMQRGWVKRGAGVRTTIENTEGYTDYVMGRGQARLNKMVGWRQVADVIATNIKGAIRHAEAMIKTLKR